jgi:hypothetical protein
MSEGKHLYERDRCRTGTLAHVEGDEQLLQELTEAAANIGVQATSATALQLEQYAHTGDAEQIASACATLEAGLGRLGLLWCALTEEVVP